MNSSVAVKGMAWAGGAVIVGRLLGLVSQVLLGILLPVEVFAVFALVLLMASLLGGFQDSGVARVLIGRHQEFRELVQDYISLAFGFAVVGASLLSGLGILVSVTSHEKYDGLAGAVFITALSMPVVAVAAVHVAALSLDHRFKFLSFVDIARMTFYYAIVVVLAAAGFGPYVIAVGTLAGAWLHLFLLRGHTRKVVPAPRRLPLRRAGALLFQIRWALGTSFVTALAMRGDYLVLSFSLTAIELGYYHFGFMLLAQVMVVVSAAIAQVLTPVFAKMRDSRDLLRGRFVKGAAAITHFAGLISLLVVLTGPAVMHWVWDGKWDDAAIVVTTVALTLPYRMTGMVGVAVLEAMGSWRRRFLLLAVDAFLLSVLAFVGAHFWGMAGAAILVAVQRGASGLIGFLAACGRLGLPGREILAALVRAVMPYSLVAVFLGWQAWAERAASSLTAWIFGSLCAATCLLLLGIMLFDRESLHVIRTYSRRLASR